MLGWLGNCIWGNNPVAPPPPLSLSLSSREDTGDVQLLSITGEGAQLYAGTQQATTDGDYNGGTVAASTTAAAAEMVKTRAADVVRSTTEARRYSTCTC